MPLLCLDLDGTLVDRDTAANAWLRAFVIARGGNEGLVHAAITADGGGHRPKPEVRDDLTRLLDLTPDESARIIEDLRAGIIEHLTLVPDAIEALARARTQGWTLLIVTNGATSQQQAKLAATDLAAHVDGWVISEECGVAKPDPVIFTLAVEQVPGLTTDDLAGAWHIGDSAEADVQGAHSAGLRSIWLRRGRDYPEGVVAPTAMADSFSEAVDIVLTSR
ncbi:HAD family hydrolase [Propionibacteriaceae bacterium G1746]|uniref:HAD family hydrolase n=1 Tax=Aestuariimicrobium sp. G57 TaxID=3418485 RepID=UPI003C1B579A